MSSGEEAAAGPARGTVEVAVLGPVEVRGAARPFRRAWSLELVVYLAMHPEGVTSSQWAAALWPDRIVADPTRHSIASAARRSLGAGPCGDHLPRRHGGLRLAASVVTDWQRLRTLAADGEPTAWAAALGLVRGRPFDGLRDPDWAVLEGTMATIEEEVGALAVRLGEHCLAAGDGRRAASAARRGLLASPYDERLFRVLLRAADALGNPAGVEAVMAELLGLVDGPADPSTTAARRASAVLHPQTASLYEVLSRRRRTHPVAGGRLVRL
ncbi:MAG: AfsR/SARP family transcriptional regulator [Acidimicrobiales bacterium]